MIIPSKLQKGDIIRVIAPSRSLSIVGDNIQLATRRWEEEWFNVTFSKHCKEIDEFNSSSIDARIEDLHDAFSDESVKGIFTAIGGYNANQLLQHIDYELIKANPKILCGFSDITVLSNAIYQKTGLVTYSWPHFSTRSMQKEFDYNLEYFKKCLMQEAPFSIEASETWSDDLWFLDQENRKVQKNEGFWTIHEGDATGTIIGWHLRCFSALQGTEYMPFLDNSIVFIEEDEEIIAGLFNRGLQSLIHMKEFTWVKGIVIWRFQNKSTIDRNLLEKIISIKKELKKLPIIANVNFGHTNPICTFPIGGVCRIVAQEGKNKIDILIH
jgi:muramoyltetrapeptide carboxypeptidase